MILLNVSWFRAISSARRIEYCKEEQTSGWGSQLLDDSYSDGGEGQTSKEQGEVQECLHESCGVANLGGMQAEVVSLYSLIQTRSLTSLVSSTSCLTRESLRASLYKTIQTQSPFSDQSFLFFPRYPVQTRKSRIADFVPLFDRIELGVIPSVFKHFVEETCLKSSSLTTTEEVQQIEIEKDEIRFCITQQNVTALQHKIPAVSFSLAIIDVPYGLGSESWDSEVFSFFFFHSMFAISLFNLLIARLFLWTTCWTWLVVSVIAMLRKTHLNVLLCWSYFVHMINCLTSQRHWGRKKSVLIAQCGWNPLWNTNLVWNSLLFFSSSSFFQSILPQRGLDLFPPLNIWSLRTFRRLRTREDWNFSPSHHRNRDETSLNFPLRRYLNGSWNQEQLNQSILVRNQLSCWNTWFVTSANLEHGCMTCAWGQVWVYRLILPQISKSVPNFPQFILCF